MSDIAEKIIIVHDNEHVAHVLRKIKKPEDSITYEGPNCSFCGKYDTKALCAGPDTFICLDCNNWVTDELRKVYGFQTVKEAFADKYGYDFIHNVIQKYRAFGFSPPLHPDKYFVPISIKEWDKVVDYIKELEGEVAKLRRQNRGNSADFLSEY